MNRLIVSLCDRSGVWSEPYVQAGYRVVRVDLGHEPGERKVTENLWHVGADITTATLPERPWGVLAAPSCTCFCRPGARWWGRMDSTGQTEKDVALFRKCLEICRTAEGWWALENPPGRHPRLMPEVGKPAWSFQPWEFGDRWGKQTYIWGTAARPFATNIVKPEPTRRTPNGKTQGRIAFMSSSWKTEREKTPPGFARAFFESNQ
jgi:hypothetical protein